MKRQYIVGVLAGWAFWIALIAIDGAYSAWISDIPKAIRAVADPVVTVIGLAAYPLALGGWLLWGDNYLAITSNPALNISICLTLHGTLGVLVAKLRHRVRPLRMV